MWKQLTIISPTLYHFISLYITCVNCLSPIWIDGDSLWLPQLDDVTLMKNYFFMITYKELETQTDKRNQFLLQFLNTLAVESALLRSIEGRVLIGIQCKVRSWVFIWSPFDLIHLKYVALNMRFEKINT